jgi:ATP-dependent RNA helicase DDX5/DBP2
MFSATWPEEVKQLAREFINDPIKIKIGNMEQSLNKDIKQHVIFAPENLKFERFQRMIDEEQLQNKKTLIFTETKIKCD